MIRKPLGAILTGGRSSRMGADKTGITVGSATMLEHVNAALRSVCGRVVLLGPDRDGWDTWADAVHVGGPLAGVATALSRTAESQVLAVAVDHPFVRPETLQHLVVVGSDVPVVPVDDHGTRQVTCALYPTSIATAAAEEAAEGGSIQTLLDRVSFRPVPPEEWAAWGEDGRSWYSVDSPEAIEEGLRRFGAI